ncbi:MAG: WS/DGAT domain-containing protein, partial [Jatrophihabitantaceae bacterium]
RTRLDDFREVRGDRRGTVNDAVRAVVTGALRSWLLGRGEQLSASATVRALVPVGVRAAGPGGGAAGTVGGTVGCAVGTGGWAGAAGIAALLVDLPIGEPDPLGRLRRVQHATAVHAASGLSVGADALVGLSGFAPPTLHSLGARAANGLTRRLYDVAITDVPGPQQPLYAAGCELAEMFPIMPLAAGHALAFGITSYNGGVYFAINADLDAVPDVAEIAELVPATLAELVAASRPADIEPGRPRRRSRERARS